MSDSSPVKPVKLSQEKENIYLTLVDMFVDVVEPSIVLMVLQNRNWDLDAALEDIMIISNTPVHERPHHTSSSLNNVLEDETAGTDCHFMKRPCSVVREQVSASGSTSRRISKSSSSAEAGYKGQFGAKKQESNINLSNKQTFLKQFVNENKPDQVSISQFLDEYNNIKTVPVAYERSLLLIKSGIKLMVILRGPPGSGKSHLAKKLLIEAGIDQPRLKRHIYSSDDFFIKNNVYIFVPDQLGEAHERNQCNVKNAIREQISPIVVDNTNSQAWEMQAYAKLAVTAGYDLELLEPVNWWSFKESELAKRNVHGVPKHKIRIMIERYEKNVTPSKLLQQFDLRYTLSNAPPQPVRNKSRKDKLSSYRNNKPKKKKSEIRPKYNVCQDNCSGTSNKFSTLSFEPPELSSNPQLSFTVESLNLNDSDLKLFSDNTYLVEESDSVHQVQSNCLPTNLDYCFLSHSSNKNLKTLSRVCDQIEDNSKDRPIIDSGERSSLVDSSLSSCKPLGKLCAPTIGQSKSETLFEHETIAITKELPYTAHQSSQHNFDFMEESNKLLKALGRSLPVKEVREPNTEKSIDNNSYFLSRPIKCNPNKTTKSSELEDDGTFEELDSKKQCQYFSKESPHPSKISVTVSSLNCNSVEEKTLCAENLLDSILERVVDSVALDKEENKNTKDLIEKTIESQVFSSERDYSWDYVLVNEDHSFTYKKINFTPIASSITANSNLFEQTDNEMGNACLKNKELGKELLHKNESIHTSLENNSERNNCSIKSKSLVDSNESKNTGVNMQGGFEYTKDANLRELDLTVDTENLDIGNMTLAIDDHQKINSVFNGGKQNTHESDLLVKVSEENQTHVKRVVGTFFSSKALSNENCTDNNMSNTNSKSGIDLSQSFRLDKDFEKEVASENIKLKESLPKPPRNLARSRFLLTDKTSLQVINPDFSNWNTVPNPYENWSSDKISSSVNDLSVESVSLPQRVKTSKRFENSSTNTNYLDFLLINKNSSSETEYRVLQGCCRTITDGCQKSEKTVAETLLLDKSTMTSEKHNEEKEKKDLNEIRVLFPEIPEQYLLDMVDKCQGDIDWAVNLLFDSEHNIFPEVDGNVNIGKTELLRESDTKDKKSHHQHEINRKDESKKKDTAQHSELKKMLESAVVFNKSHYSDSVLKVMRKKNPEYLNLIENNELSKVVDSDDCKGNEILSSNHITEIESETVESSGEGSSNIKSESDEKNEDDEIVELAISNDVILQLQQKFGSSRTPKIMNSTPLVKLPVSLARQVYGYIMDSIQSEIDEQQEIIENMIANDEEIAKLLQYQDENHKPDLQEIMDFEVALAVHRADQEEWEGKNQDTVAAKLSKNILLEKFPRADPKVLLEMFHSHNYSLHDTIASLTLAFGNHENGTVNTVGSQSGQSLQPVRATTSTCEPDSGVEVDPVTEAQSHREEAATYYSLRMDCLNKAHEAFRSGNKQVASYYSQLAQMHKGKMEQCNSQAASCLLSSHKAGHTLDLHFLLVTEAEVVLDMFLDATLAFLHDNNKRYQRVFLITGRGLRSVGGVSRIKPMVIRKLHARKILFNEVNPGMLSALIKADTPLSCV